MSSPSSPEPAPEQDEFASLVLPPRPQAPQVPPNRKFQGWHHPRKQWIRRRQWVRYASDLVRRIRFQDGARIFRYLGMPGEDMLDLRTLRRVCVRSELELHYVGVVYVKKDSPEESQLNISDSDVRGMPFVHNHSKIIRDRIEAIANDKAVSRKTVEAAAPYHFINADLTGHIALDRTQQNRPTYLEALGKIISMQIASARHPWLLFVTTRVAPGDVDPANISALARVINANVYSSEPFKARLGELLGRHDNDLGAALANPECLDPKSFNSFFSVGLGKWLLAYSLSGNPSFQVTMLESCFYSVYSSDPDMLSLAFRFDPTTIAPRDTYGVLSATRPAPAPDEVGQALAVLEQASRMLDLDDLMNKDDALRESMIAESIELLREAHFKVGDGGERYRSWLRGENVDDLETEVAAVAAPAASPGHPG